MDILCRSVKTSIMNPGWMEDREVVHVQLGSHTTIAKGLRIKQVGRSIQYL